jgi:hypothetical protein
MANFPYTASTKSIADALAAFRKALPSTVDSDTFKKLQIAPNNESNLISILTFLKVIDGDGKPVPKSAEIFYATADKFSEGLTLLIEAAYNDVFSLFGSDTWNEPQDKLVGFFRQADKTSQVTGERQARTFVALCELSGKRTGHPTAAAAPKTKATTSKPKASKPAPLKATPTAAIQMPMQNPPTSVGGGLSLTVRIEVNLPASADQTVYDSIFKSIRENLIDQGT